MENSNRAKKTAFSILFSYSTKSLKKSDLVKFFYALKGRNNKPGIIQRTDSKFLAKGVIETSAENKEEFEEFFDYWDVSYKEYKFKETSKNPNYALFNYSTSHLKKKDLVRFHYALKGRGKKPGLISRTDSEFLAKTLLLAPASEIQSVEEFFSVWDCDYEKREVRINE